MLTDRRILFDTGALVALFNSADSRHRLCADTFAVLAPPLLTCWPVLMEAAWLLGKQPGPIDRIADAPIAGMFKSLPLENGCLADTAAIMRRYEDAGLNGPMPRWPISPNGRAFEPSSRSIGAIFPAPASSATARSNWSRRCLTGEQEPREPGVASVQCSKC